MNELIEQINNHDWEYNNSDDSRVFERGLTSEASIMRQLPNVNYEELENHFDDYVKKKLKVLYVRAKY